VFLKGRRILPQIDRYSGFTLSAVSSRAGARNAIRLRLMADAGNGAT
jgi:hypothetical protein